MKKLYLSMKVDYKKSMHKKGKYISCTVTEEFPQFVYEETAIKDTEEIHAVADYLYSKLNTLTKKSNDVSLDITVHDYNRIELLARCFQTSSFGSYKKSHIKHYRENQKTYDDKWIFNAKGIHNFLTNEIQTALFNTYDS